MTEESEQASVPRSSSREVSSGTSPSREDVSGDGSTAEEEPAPDRRQEGDEPRKRTSPAADQTGATASTPPRPRTESRPPGRPAYPIRSVGDGSSAITIDRVIRFVLGASALALGGWILWTFAGLVLYLAVGGIFAYLLRPMVDRLQGLGFTRVPAILTTFVLVFGILAFVVTSILPFIAQQVRDLSQLVSMDAAVAATTYLEDWLRGVVPIEEGALVENVRQVSRSLMEGDLVEGDRVAQTVSSVVSVFTNIVYATVIIPFITFFLLKDGVQIRRSLLGFVPNRYFEITLAILDKVEANIGRYFRALFVQCTSIAIIASVLLWGVGLQNSLAIGIFTGLANTIPYFGPFLGFIGGALVGVAQTGGLGLVPGVALAMGLTQLADNVLLQPIIFSRAAQAHPLVILFVVLVGAQLAGIVGMLIAIPLATTVRVVIEQVLWSLRNYRILRSGT